MKRYQIILGAVGFLAVLGLAGTGDMQEAQAQERVYTDMVCKGYWPDYEGRKPKCQESNSQTIKSEK